MCVLFLVLGACGGPQTFEMETPGVGSEVFKGRCTVDNRLPNWECCDDDSLVCSGDRDLRVCVSHKLVALSDSECLRIMEDPRRPEFQKYRDLCNRSQAGAWLVCPPPAY